MSEQKTDEPNMYAPPTAADPTPGTLSGLTRERLPMPMPVYAAASIVGFYLALLVFGLMGSSGEGGIGKAVVTGLILIGIFRGNALSWQWGRIIPVVIAAVVSILLVNGLTGNSRQLPLQSIVMFCMLLAGSIALPILLSFQSSKRYFGLRCPSCGSLRSKANNFFYSEYRCRDCKSTWR